MYHSFILTDNPHNIDFHHSITHFYDDTESKKFHLGNMQLTVRCSKRKDNESLSYINNVPCFIVGTISNTQQLKNLLLPYDSHALTYDQHTLVYHLINLFGSTVVGLLEGKFVVIHVNNEEVLSIYTDTSAQIPVYYCTDSRDVLWITSEIKNILDIDSIDFTIKNITNIYKGKYPISSSVSPYCYIHRLPPLTRLKIVFKKKFQKFYQTRYVDYCVGSNIQITKTTAEDVVDRLLNDTIHDIAHDNKALGIPLSGGLDSSLITAMARKTDLPIHTFCAGTNVHNEFTSAAYVARHLGTNHHEIVFDMNELKESFLQTMFYNELFDSLCLEIQTPFTILYRYIYPHVSTIITGYGADALFAGHISSTDSYPMLNNHLYASLLTTQWRGEYTQNTANRYGLTVYHPFCTNKLIRFALHLHPSLKLHHAKNKYVVRELAKNRQYLPDIISHRKKIAIEVASSINKLFSEYLGLIGNSYDKKNIYTLEIYKELFQNKKHISEIDISKFKNNIYE